MTGAAVYTDPQADPIPRGVVVVNDGIIAAVGTARTRIPKTARVLDCSGCTVTAGLWNSHVHFFERKWADAGEIPAAELREQLLDFGRYGFTSVFDLSSPWENTRIIRDRIRSGEVPGPRIRSTGEGLVPPETIPPENVMSVMGMMNLPLPEVHDAAEAATCARHLLEQGVDGIKIFAASPRAHRLPEDALRAAVEQAKRFAKRVFLHPNSAADVFAALRAGVDVIAHTTPHGAAWDEELLQAVRESGAALTPTLSLWQHYARHDRWSAQQRIAQTSLAQLHSWLDAGAIVLFGTDYGAVGPDPAQEYAMMQRAGMTFRQILEAATRAPAAYFGEADERGTIAPGLAADLAVFRGDPSADIRAMARVDYTICAGNVTYCSRWSS